MPRDWASAGVLLGAGVAVDLGGALLAGPTPKQVQHPQAQPLSSALPRSRLVTMALDRAAQLLGKKILRRSLQKNARRLHREPRALPLSWTSGAQLPPDCLCPRRIYSAGG